MKKKYLILIIISLHHILLFSNNIVINIKLPYDITFNSSKMAAKGTMKFVLPVESTKGFGEFNDIRIEGLCYGLDTDTALNVNNISVHINIPILHLKKLFQENKNNILVIPDCGSTITDLDVKTDDCKEYVYESSNGYIMNSNIEIHEINQILQITIDEKKFIDALLKGNKAMLDKKRKDDELQLKSFFDSTHNYVIPAYIEFEVSVNYEILNILHQ